MKYVFYLRGSNRQVVITDNSQNIPLKTIKNKIADVLSDTKIGIFETESDIFISRPNEIIGIHIQKKETPTNKEITNDYPQEINIEELGKDIEIDLDDEIPNENNIEIISPTISETEIEVNNPQIEENIDEILNNTNDETNINTKNNKNKANINENDTTNNENKDQNQ